MFRRLASICVCVASCCTPESKAEVILDTGPIEGATSSIGLSENAWQAMKFELESDTRIEGLEGYMYQRNDVEMIGSIYSDNNGLPGQSLFEEPFDVLGSANNVPDWFGLAGLNWELDAGSFWAVFSSREGAASGAMPYVERLSPPRAHFVPEIDGEPLTGVWQPGIQPRNPGFRIRGTVVPEPTGLAQVVLMGLLLTINTRRDKRMPSSADGIRGFVA